MYRKFKDVSTLITDQLTKSSNALYVYRFTYETFFYTISEVIAKPMIG